MKLNLRKKQGCVRCKKKKSDCRYLNLLWYIFEFSISKVASFVIHFQRFLQSWSDFKRLLFKFSSSLNVFLLTQISILGTRKPFQEHNRDNTVAGVLPLLFLIKAIFLLQDVPQALWTSLLVFCPWIAPYQLKKSRQHTFQLDSQISAFH